MAKVMVWRPLARKVLVVAVYDTEIRDWAAYIDAVPGYDHTLEYTEVAVSGEKLSRHIAELIFPFIAMKYHWRD